MKATRWVIIRDGSVCEVAITTPNGKRLKAVTKEEIASNISNPDQCQILPIQLHMRITPLPKVKS